MDSRQLLGAALLLLAASAALSAPPGVRYSRALDWLSRYGYLPPPDPRTGKLQTREGIELALREMQRFAGLKETGRLDGATLSLMSTPRCSLPDIVGMADLLKRRRRRYALSGLRWEKTEITWSVHGYPSLSSSPSLPADLVELVLRHALSVWSDVTPLRFYRLSRDGGGRQEEGDIRVTFTRSFHDDGYPFDGRGGTLAHAFFPGTDALAGDAHFDDEETWSFGGDTGSTDLFTVAIHEFGHALGLSHSSSEHSIMRPYYLGSVGDIQKYRLSADDRLGIQTLYGMKMTPITARPDVSLTPGLPHFPSPPPPRPTTRLDRALPNRCEGGYDAVANIRGEVFFFKGPYFWRIQRSGSLVSLSPALIRNFWIGLPSGINKIDAVYERKSGSHIVFFIGDQYWIFRDTVALPGYPRPLVEWGVQTVAGKGLSKVDAAFVWAHTGKTYLFSGGEFWRFDELGKKVGMKPEGGYPKQASLWKGVPPDPDDIISWGNGDTYFFKDDSYWVLKRGRLDQENVTSKSISADWMGCAPPPSPTPSPTNGNAKCYDCICKKNGGIKVQTFHWLFLLSVSIIIRSLKRY
ncbi:matrix metalloproteinase-25-like [Paramormyrops kingsleyae]|uniref:Matrix metalloproteinase-25-like n=1 Tax=Paramormyrops kingsleyae TaxID=1676925 RepID=A0A3B3Q493_9TELE|nr:matrix metalloproteinase-25-like isoform X1 [Paramormyrops kingsleyae]